MKKKFQVSLINDVTGKDFVTIVLSLSNNSETLVGGGTKNGQKFRDVTYRRRIIAVFEKGHKKSTHCQI